MFPKLSKGEAALLPQLEQAAGRHGWQIRHQVRVREVIDLNSQNLPKELRDYGMRATFDFVLVDEQGNPLLVFEFDGELHDKEIDASERDRKKNSLCHIAEVPVARLQTAHIGEILKTEIPTWVVELFWTMRMLSAAQERGDIPNDEYPDPMLVVTSSTLAGDFPLELSWKAKAEIARVARQNGLHDGSVFFVSGIDTKGRATCFAAVRLTETKYLWAHSTLSLYGFGFGWETGAYQVTLALLGEMVAHSGTRNRRARSMDDFVTALVRFLERLGQLRSLTEIPKERFGVSIRHLKESEDHCWSIEADEEEPLIIPCPGLL